MTDVTENVPPDLKSDLDSRRKAVSSGAIERSGQVTEVCESSISFQGIIKINHLTNYDHTVAPPECEYCDPSTPESLKKCLLESPFSTKDSYDIPDAGTHEKIPCPTCGKSGRIVCSECNGNGRVPCENCNGQGTVFDDFPCDRCGHLESPRENCRVCDGSGKIESKSACYYCNGYGHNQCETCSGSGVMRCDYCLGERYQHQFESTEYSLSRSIEACNFPGNWSDNHQRIADMIKWETDQIDIHRDSRHTFQVQTDTVMATFFKVDYRSSRHHCASVDQPLRVGKVIWDPDTTYPRTSIRRKLSDIKSRIFW